MTHPPRPVVKVGKSTMLGVLTHNELDNGRGKSRLNLFRHKHEEDTGRTTPNSTIAPLFSKTAQNLNLRYVLVSDPPLWVLGPKHVSTPE